MPGDDNMGSMDLNESALKTIEPDKNEIPYNSFNDRDDSIKQELLGEVNEAPLAEVQKLVSPEVTDVLAQENAQIIQQDGVHPTWVDVLKEKAEEFKDRILPKNIDLKTTARVGLATVMVAALITEASCAAKPVNADTVPTANATDTLGAKAEESQVGTNNTGVEEVPTENIYPTPAIEEAKSPVPEPEATKESPYFAVDLGFSKEEIVNKGFLISVNNYIKENNYEKYPYQYQAWFDNGKISITYYNQAYVAEARGGKSLMEFGGASGRYGFTKGSLELKIFDAVMESGINTKVYMNEEYLDPELQNVKATVAYVVTDGDRHYYYMIGTDGIAVYVDNENVSVYSGNKIPSFLPDGVKQKFKEGYTRVENNNGEIEAYGNIKEVGQSGL